MKNIVVLLNILLLCAIDMFAQSVKVLPTKNQVEWINKEIGVMIHFDINIYSPNTFNYQKKETLPSLSVFNPSKLNTDQWIESAKNAGAKYAILTVKHGTGFCLWPTKAHDYHVGNTPLRGGNVDILADFVKSCKKYGLKPGLYYNTNMNTLYEAGYIPMTEEKRLEFNEVVYGQLLELWSGYGEMLEIWFDGGVMSDSKLGIASRVKDLIDTYQPNACLFGAPANWKNVLRWVGNEDGRAPYPQWSRVDDRHDRNGRPDGKYWIPSEADFPNRNKSGFQGGWLWNPNDGDEAVFTAEELLDRFYTSVGRNANMMIGMAIDTSGLFPTYDKRVFEEFGNLVKQRENSVVGKTKGKGDVHLIKFKNPQFINQIEIEEDIAEG